MHRIVITGSSGRIGRALHWKLCQDHIVNGLDISPSSATSKLVDIRDFEQLLRSFEGVDTIFHAAALHAPHVGIVSEKEFYEINVHATEKICKAALVTGVSQIVFTSTTALYGYANYGKGNAVWVDEQTRHRGVDYRDVAEAHILAGQLNKDKCFDIYVVSGSTPFLKSDSKMLFENPEMVIRDRQPLLADEFDKRGWEFPASIDRIYDSSYAQKNFVGNLKEVRLRLLSSLITVTLKYYLLMKSE